MEDLHTQLAKSYNVLVLLLLEIIAHETSNIYPHKIAVLLL